LDFRTNNPGTLREIFCNANVLAAFVQKQGEKEAVELECARKKSERSIEQQVKANEVRDNFVPVKSAMFAAGGRADWYKKFHAKELVAAANTLRAIGANKMTTMPLAIPFLEMYRMDQQPASQDAGIGEKEED
jgi:hypothetical protein